MPLNAKTKKQYQCFLLLPGKIKRGSCTLSPGKTKRGSCTLVLVRLWLGGYRSVDANIVLDI